MQDRVPLYPGRVRLTPVSGQENTYDMVRADETTQEGTPLNKATFLKDATAALYGLTNTAVPDDVFAWLGRFNEYCWKRRSVTATVNTSLTSATPLGSGNLTIYYSSQITDDGNGNPILVDPSTFSYSYSSAKITQLVSLAPCYIQWTKDSVKYTKYLPEGSTAGEYYNSDNTICWDTYNIGGGQIVDKKYAKTHPALNIDGFDYSFGDWEEVYSTDRNAYPDSGISDGYEYEFFGRPYDKFLEVGTKIAAGSYTGTGTCGPANPTTLSFDFAPKLVVIKTKDNATLPTILFAGDSVAKSIVYIFGGGDLTVTTSGNSISWYHSGNTWTANGSSGGSPNMWNQLNGENTVYSYAAFG